MSSLQLLLDIGALGLNATLALVEDKSKVFTCTNNPLADYYALTKSLNVIDFVASVKNLIINKQTPQSLETPPRIDCMKMDTIYRQALRIEAAFKQDVDGVIKNKLNCFRNSIFAPLSSVADNFRNIFDSVAANADSITILTTQTNKILDLVKLLSWLGDLFGTSSLLVGVELLIEFFSKIWLNPMNL